MEEKPKTVQITATQAHSYHGEDYDIGDTYDADESDVTTIQVQGKGYPSDPKSLAKAQEKAAKAPASLAGKAKAAKTAKKGRK